MSHTQSTLDGFALGDAGAARAIAHADAVEPNWADQVRGFLAGFIRQRPYFSSEDFWLACEASGIPKPPDRRSYGGIFKSAIKRGLIRKVGTGRSQISRLHANPICVYERT